MITPTKEGWGLPTRAKKWHYFFGSAPLCGRFRFFSGQLWYRKDDSPDNCLECRGKKKKFESSGR